MKRIILLMVVALVGMTALSVSVAHAQSKSVVVERRDAEMLLHPDGHVDVVETWVVNFQGGPFRYAFRTIPFNRISSLQFRGVSENGQAYQRSGGEIPNTFEVTSDAGERTLTWYFEPTTNATRTFELRYTLYDALRVYDEGDQFWWKFVESERGYPIQSARVKMQLPSEFPPNQILATTYVNGQARSGTDIVNGSAVNFSGGPFADGTEWEIRVQFPHGAVTQSKQAWQVRDDQIVAAQELAAQRAQRFTFYSMLATLLVLVGGALGLLLLWFVQGRDVAVPAPAEFLNAPPDAPPGSGKVLTPALAGTLIDEEANVRDVLATLIDWAQRGVIKIRALPQGAKTPDPNDDYVFERLNNAPPLTHPYERELMQRLFQGETSRNMRTIREKFTNALDSMFDNLYNELRADGYFAARPDRVRGQYRSIAWLLLVMLCPAAFLFQILASQIIAEDMFFALPALAPWFALGVILIALMVLARYLPRKTRAGSQAAARWNAFRRYLENVEKYTNVAAAQEQFEKYLPYAIAFGIDKTWVEKFAAVDTPAPKWYIPPPSAGASHGSPSGTSSSTATRPGPFSGSASTNTSGSASPASSSSPAPAPSLNRAASGAFTSLNNISASFFSMLNTTATTFVASNPSSSPGSRSSRSGSDSSSWHSSSSSSHSSFSGGSGGGGGGGGGRSGFG
jgi:uncharacterized membrane protein YgcG